MLIYYVESSFVIEDRDYIVSIVNKHAYFHALYNNSYDMYTSVSTSGGDTMLACGSADPRGFI